MDGRGGALPGAVRALGALVEACLGPAGGHAVVQARARGEGLVLSGRAGRLFEALSLQGPALELLVAGSGLAQHRAHGDGGLACTALAARLAGRVLSIEGAWKRAEAVAAFRLALEWCCEACGLRLKGGSCAPLSAATEGGMPLATSFRWSQESTLRALALSVLSTASLARLSPGEAEHLAKLVVHAFAHAIPDRASKGTCVRVEGVIGLATEESHWFEGLLLDTPVCSRARQALPFRGGTMALFASSLDCSTDLRGEKNPAARTVPVQLEYGGDLDAEQVKRLLRLVSRLKAAGVGIVCSQRVIHDKVKDALTQANMLFLERLSARHADAFARCTGALLLASIDPEAVDRMIPAFGSMGALEEVHLSEKRLLLMHPPPHAGDRAMPVATVVVGASNSFAMRELKSVTASAVQTLSKALEAPYTLPGGGQAEMKMAKYVAERARDLPVGQRKEALFMSNCLKMLSRTVVGARSDTEEGVVAEAPVVDLAVSKLSALTLAVEAAAMFASVGASVTLE